MTAVFYIICSIILLIYVGLIGFYHYCYRKSKYFKIPNGFEPIPLTVLIPARNESVNIIHCLQSIYANDYPKELLTVIVIDDQSTDDTAQKVKEQFPQVKLLQLAPTQSGSKKIALTAGVQAATTNFIICTDADCTVPTTWLMHHAAYFVTTKAQFIAAPVRLVPQFAKSVKWSLVQIFQCIDFVALQGITAGVVNKKVHMMSNGANMAFTKHVFNQVNGFAGIDHIATGDDMLLMQKIADQFNYNVGYLKTQKAMVDSLTVNTWREFIKQRIRWSSKASHYTDKKLYYALLLVYITNVLSFTLLTLLFFTTTYWLWVLLFLLVKSLVEFRFFAACTQFFQLSQLNRKFWFFIPIHIVYVIVAGWFGKFARTTWKDRMA